MTETEIMYDKNRLIIECIDSAVIHATMLKNIIPSETTTKLESLLRTIQEEYPPNFRAFILGQLLEMGTSEPLYLTLWEDKNTYKLSLEKVETIPPKAKKKWYQF